jgi:protein involved in polysaccharide export with SLBB domain
MTPDSLKAALIRDYRVYLNNPSIEVMFLRRINVLGAVRLPGLYPVDPTMTLSDVIAAAGGPTPIGEPDKARLIRNGRAIDAALTRETRVSEMRLHSGDQVFVPERSWFTRNSAVVAAALTATVSLMIAFVRH